MSGLIGAVSPKFAIHAGVLVLSARIEMLPVTAVLDPSVQTTVVDQDSALRLGVSPTLRQTQLVTRNKVIGLDHSEFRLQSVRVEPPGGFGSVVIGTDLLEHARIMLDFGRSRIGVLEPSALRHKEKNMTFASMLRTQDGCLSISATDVAGNSTSVAIVGRGTANPEYQDVLTIGHFRLPAMKRIKGDERCKLSQYTLSWDGFASRRIILDLGGERIWIAG